MLRAKFDTRAAEQAFRNLRQGTPAAVVRALNRAGESTVVALARSVAKDTGVKVSAAKAALSVTRATEQQPVVTVKAHRRRIALAKFGARGPMPSRGRGRGVTARLVGGAGRYPGAFMVKFKSGHVAVVKREGRKRGPLVELHGPSVAQSAGKFVDEAARVALDTMARRLTHEFGRLWKGQQ